MRKRSESESQSPRSRGGSPRGIVIVTRYDVTLFKNGKSQSRIASTDDASEAIAKLKTMNIKLTNEKRESGMAYGIIAHKVDERTGEAA
jgi:hypothetical protein